MTRLVIFISFLLSLLTSLCLLYYQKSPSSQVSFDFEKAKQLFEEKEKFIELSNAPKHVSEEIHEEVAEVSVKPPIEINTPELQLGYDTYKKMKCQTCHGNFGEGKKSQLAPRIASQFDWYIEEQVKAVRDGGRINGKMLPYVKKLTDEDAKNLAYFLSRIPN